MTLETLGERYVAARSDAKAARNEYLRVLKSESGALRDKLLKKPLGDRFKALEESGQKLLAADRRTLMRSLKNATPEKRAIAATTASRYEIWRSRLPFRIFPLIVCTIAVATGAFLIAVGYHHTPEESVTIAAAERFQVKARGPDGELSDFTVTPGDRFALVRIEGGEGILRRWVPSQGYADFQVPVQYLRQSP
jgi:hypothetical protein